jgi:hypothetical protein
MKRRTKMADKTCEEACKAAYSAKVGKLFEVFFDCLATATDDGAKKECLDRFRRGMNLAKEAREECLKVCG